MAKRMFTPDQIAPCGMNCGLCSAYLAFSHGIPKKRGKISHCSGCRARPKNCAYIKGQCRLLSSGKVTFCFECPDFPCTHLEKIDRRYQTTYGISFIGNLKEISDAGIGSFLQRQSELFLCRKCRTDVVSVHNNKCYRCDRVVHWKARSVNKRRHTLGTTQRPPGNDHEYICREHNDNP